MKKKCFFVKALIKLFSCGLLWQMWILLHKLSCARNNAWLYFHNSKLHFILRSHFIRLTELRFLYYCRLPQLMQNCREHSGRFLSFPVSSTLVTSEFSIVQSYWVLNPVAQIWAPKVIHTVNLLPSAPPQGLPSPSCRCCDGVGHRFPATLRTRPPSPLDPQKSAHLLWDTSTCSNLPAHLLWDTSMSCNNLPAIVKWKQDRVVQNRLNFSLTVDHLSKGNED